MENEMSDDPFNWVQFTPHGLLLLIAEVLRRMGLHWVKKVEKKIDQLDEVKADKTTVDQRFGEVLTRLNRQDQIGDLRHTENTTLMRAIIRNLMKNGRMPDDSK